MLWVEGRLSRLEKLSMASFLACGHPVELYTYGLDDDPPTGVVVRDATEIVPAAKRFRHGSGMGYGSWATFSDVFRFTLLYERGGIWCDTDMVCLKPLLFSGDSDVLFASEHVMESRGGKTHTRAYPNTGMIRVPARHRLMEVCLDKCRGMDLPRAQWAASGPGVLRAVIEEQGATQHVLHPDIFCSIPHWEFTSLLFGARAISPNAYAIHFWNEVLRWNFFDKDARYDKHSIYERLSAHYLGATHGA